MSRRFVALGLPAAVRDVLDAAIAPLREGRDELSWSDPAGWHVTLAFLGELPDDRLAAVRRAVEEAITVWRAGDAVDERAASSAQPVGSGEPGAAVDEPSAGGVVLRVAGAGRFGHRVLHAEVVDHPSGTVATLGAHVQAALAEADLPVDRREVRPHVTLARARRRSRVTDHLVDDADRALVGLGEDADRARPRIADGGPGPSMRWVADRVAIWSAQDRRGPARYLVDGEVPLRR